ncbi:PD-(D/E)XK nuclease family protein [Flavobacterium sp. N502540]|uniref:PD-(D/E)XK nuclease family protein n=1 Tax=Flavobacterium sp. N502540 TaxID=2986838 RepID=UPI0022251620|nr:PD-(D/E)XK nuclease family protein [Flavobacterium sp. N502540]
MKYQPNIFDYATSELTQDAFIIWLLHWANPIYKTENKPLHELGTSFLQSLLAFKNIIIGDISELDIKPQYHKIDIFLKFKMNNCTYGVIIEDKVHTNNRKNQLEVYKNKIIDLKICDTLVLIYFKTGYQVDLSQIKDNGYHYYSIKDFLKIIAQEKITQINNDVLSQYYDYLLKREIDYDMAHIEANNYLTKPVRYWTWWTTSRFFHEYKKRFDGNWGEVPNNREALLAFWFGGKKLTSIDERIGIYMDITFKHNKLHVNYRLSLKDEVEINIQIRNDIYNNFTLILQKNGVETRKPKYSKAKESMLLAEITNIDDELNHIEFAKKIDFYQSVLNEYVDSINPILI